MIYRRAVPYLTSAARQVAGAAAPAPGPPGPPLPLPDTQPPSKPLNLRAEGLTSSGFVLAWDASVDDRGVAGYKVFVNGVAASASLQTQTSRAFSGLTSGSTSTLRVLAVDTSGLESEISDPLVVTTPTQGAFFAQITSPDTVVINGPYNFAARERHCYHVHRENYGFNIRASGINMLVRSIQATGAQLTLRLASYIMPGETLTISHVDTPTSPRQAGGAPVGYFSLAATYTASYPGPVHYVSAAGSSSAPGTQAQPWSLSKLNSTQLAPGATVFIEGGVVIQGELIAQSGVRYANWGNARAIIDAGPGGQGQAVRAENVSDVIFRGIHARNVRTPYGRQGFHVRNTQRVKMYSCEAFRCVNGILARGTGTAWESWGGHYYQCSNANVFVMGNDPDGLDNTFFEWNESHEVITEGVVAANDPVVWHNVSDSVSSGSVGSLKLNHFIRGNRIYNCQAEELLDVVSGENVVVENNWLEDASGSFMSVGWTAKDVKIRKNYFTSRTGSIPAAIIATRVEDVQIENNVFEGTVYNQYSGNGRAFVQIYANQIPREFSNKLKIRHNTAYILDNADTRSDGEPLWLQVLSLQGRSPARLTEVRNNLVISPARSAGGVYRNIIEHSNSSIQGPSKPDWDSDFNLYCLAEPTAPPLHEVDAAPYTMQQMRTSWQQEQNSILTQQIPAFLAGPGYTGPDAYIPMAQSLTGLALASEVSEDMNGYARASTPTHGAHEPR